MVDIASVKRLEDLAHVAELHYREGLDQKEIALRVHASRSTVSRMLRNALELGIVEVTIRHPIPRDTQLEQELIATLGLTEAWVLGRDSVTTDDDRLALGTLGARCVEQQLVHAADACGEAQAQVTPLAQQQRERDNFQTPRTASLAICWGRATKLIVENLQPIPRLPVRVIQMIGSLGTSDSENDGSELTRLGARRMAGSYQLLSAPLVVDDAAFARSLLKQSAIATVLVAAEQASCALVGLGSTEPKSSALLSAGFMGLDELAAARAMGAVGDVAGILIDAEGRSIPSSFSSRVISLPLARLKNIRRVVGVAFGEEKAAVIRAAAVGGHIRILVTDRSAAKRTLELVALNAASTVKAQQ